MKNIAIYTGGYSSEAPISRKSAQSIYRLLLQHDYNVYLIDVNEQQWMVEKDGKTEAYRLHDGFLIIENERISIDFAFIIVHGTPGENGQLQAYLDMHNIPYQTGDHFNMALSFSKKNTTAFLSSMGIKVAQSVYGYSPNDITERLKKRNLTWPLFVKPDTAGSSFGISKVQDMQELESALLIAFKESKAVLVEEMIHGREFTCGVFMQNNEVIALPVTEIISFNDFFDYAAKYEHQSEEQTPANINKGTKLAIQSKTVETYKVLGCKGICRVDFICNEDEEPVVIEINTIPGLTTESIIPQMFAKSAYSFEQAVLAMLEQM